MNHITKLLQAVQTWHQNLQRILAGRCAGCGLKCRQGRDCPARSTMPRPTPMPRLITEPASALKRDYRATVTLGGKSKIKAVLPNMTRMDAMVVIQNHLRANGFDREDRPTELFSITLESIKS